MSNNVVRSNNAVKDNIRATVVVVSDRPYHHGNLRETLLEQAVATLRTDGLDALSLRELARQAGVSHAAPRRHFADRQALLDALAIEGFQRLGADLREAASGDDPLQPRLRRAAHAYVAFAVRDAALLELMFAGKHDETIEKASEEAFASVLELILTGQAQAVLAPGDPEQVGLILLSTIHGVAALRVAGVIAPEQLSGLVDDAIGYFLLASRHAEAELADAR
jgi:AcrR family transcriptional regulator